MEMTNTHGGIRANSGRKSIPKPDKKLQVYLMVKTSIVEDLGGKKAVQALMERMIIEEHQKVIFGQSGQPETKPG